MEKKREIYEGFRKIYKDPGAEDFHRINDLEKYVFDQLASHQAQLVGVPKLSVGTDSKFHPKRGGWSVTYITIFAFTFGNRGTHLIMRKEVQHGTGKLSLFDRLWTEVQMTVDLAMWTRDNIGINPEVHLDVNPKRNAGSNIIYESAKGYGESMGFVVECKPDSPIAMCAADHIVRNKQ